MKIDFFTLTLDSFTLWLTERGYLAYQAEQIFRWVYVKGVTEWEGMSDIHTSLRGLLSSSFRLSSITLKSCLEEQGRYRFTWELVDKSVVHTLLRYENQKWHLTLSSQVGCPVGCLFCASGRVFIRNMQPAELFQQYLRTKKWLAEQQNREIAQIDFDGMGEPLKNVKGFLFLLDLFARAKISYRQITVSTIGIIEGINALLQSQSRLTLKVGLHAPNQQLRQQLTPYAKKNRLDELLTICRRYSMQMGLPIFFDYTLLADFNDHADQALELAHLLKHMRCHVRLIPCNATSSSWRAPDKRRVKAFRSVLFGSKISHSLYEERGDSGRLGQLAPRM